jgi:amino acid transporter
MAREHRIPVGPIVGSVGAVLLIVALFLDWYEQVTGWTVFEFLDLLLAALALCILFSLSAELGLVRARSDPWLSLVAAVVALVVVLSQIVNDPPAVAGPGGPDMDVGIWLALGGAGLMTVGAVLATTHISLAVERRGAETKWEAPPGGAGRAEAPPDATDGEQAPGRGSGRGSEGAREAPGGPERS